MPNTIFDRADLSAFTGLDGLGLEVTGQRIWPDHAVLACRITGEDRWCRRCGCQGICRDTVIRRLAHEPYGWRHTPYGDRYVTVILDVTPVRDRRGPSRLLDMIPRAAPSGSSKPGWPPSLTLGASASRSSRWVDSPGSKAQPLKNFPARERSWTPSMSCTLPGMLSMSAAGVSSKNFTIGAGVPSSLTEIITLGRTLSRIK